VQQTSVDATVQLANHNATRGFFVPARTAAVFRRAAQTSCAPLPREVFVRGSFTDWAARPEYKLNFTGGTSYSLRAPVPVGAQQFKIADVDWTDGTNCGVDADIALTVPVTLACTGNTPNIRFTPPSAGDYEFSLNAANATAPVLTIGRASAYTRDLFVRGVTGDWSANPARRMVWDGLGRYQVVIESIPVGAQQFKIADADWTDGTNCGTSCSGRRSPWAASATRRISTRI
jgi:hypothetical protein